MKITRYILSFAAAAGLLAACQTPEMVQIASPENVVPASLHELEVSEIAISATNQQEQIEFSWERADYDASTEVRYSLEAALTEDGKKVNVLSGLKDTTAVLTYEELNRVLFNDLEVAEGQATPVKFFIGSVIYAGSSISSYPKVYSQPLTLTVTVTAAEKVYPMIYVIGDFNGWADGTTQELFEFIPDTKVYSGMIGFAGKAANGWKVRGTASGWDDTCNWGLDGAAEAPAPEAGELTLISSGGSSDIKIYSKNFYHMTFDTNALKLKMNLSFDNIGVVGAFNGWSEVNNVEMQFNTVKQRFYADVVESRLFFVDKLIDMGAQIILCDPHRAVVIGHDHKYTLKAGNMVSPDIRAGIALLIAAMSAKGTSVISNIEQIDRGYEDIDVRLNALGARITRQ